MDSRERDGDSGVRRGRGRPRGRKRGNQAGEASSSSQAATRNPPIVGQQQPWQCNLSLHHSNQRASHVFPPSRLPQRPGSVRNSGNEAGETSFNETATQNPSIVRQQQQPSQSNLSLRHSYQPPTPLFTLSRLPKRPRSIRNRRNEAGEASSSQAATQNSSIVGQQQQPRQSNFPLHRSSQPPGPSHPSPRPPSYPPPRPSQRPLPISPSLPTNPNNVNQARNFL